MKKAAPKGGFFFNGWWKPDARHPALNVFALWAAGTGSPSASPYSVGVSGSSRQSWERDCRGIRFRDRCYPLRFQPGDPSMKTVVPPSSDPDAVGARRRHAHPGRRFSPFKKDLDKNPGPFLWPLTLGPRPACLRQVFISSVRLRDGSLNRCRSGRLRPGTPGVLSFRSAGRGTDRDGRWSHPLPSPPFPCRCRR